MNKILTEKMCQLKNFTLMEGKVFLLREQNSFNTSIPLIIYDICDEEKTYSKIYDIFGEREIEKCEDYIIIKERPIFEKTKFTFGDLIEIIFRLRDEDGCPWDRAQTISTIRKNIIEEAYELTEAIDLNDKEKICEECGDVVLQGAFTAAMCQEEELFSVNDSISNLCYKLISRHTHIFGKDKATNAEDALLFWEKAKAKEKKQASISDKLDSIPVTFNALMRANKVQKYIKKTGFDHPSIKEAVDKLYEEINEYLLAPIEEKENEGGDMLFSVVNILRMQDIDPEVALNGTTNRFIKRFAYVVKQVENRGKRVEEVNLDELEKYYIEAKEKEKNDNL